MSKSIIEDKSLTFAVRIVNLYKYLVASKSEFVMSKQVLRSGTSIGANVSEALCAESNADFVHKLSIAKKEASETIYWLTVLHKTDFLTTKQFDSLMADCMALKKILLSIILSVTKK